MSTRANCAKLDGKRYHSLENGRLSTVADEVYCKHPNPFSPMSAFTKHLVVVAAITLSTGEASFGSGAECFHKGHRIYVPDGLNYPRQAWTGWGITCKSPRPEGIFERETAVPGDRPAEWCGWWMRQHLSGHFGPEYNVARNWLNAGRPLAGPRPGALGVKEHHVFQVIRVVGPNEVLAISGNDHNAVRTRMRSTSDVIGWRVVSDGSIASASTTAPKQQNQHVLVKSSEDTRQVEIDTAPDGDY
jgi:hypothetical protein